MDTVMAVQGPGFVMMAADCSSARSILVFNQDEDKVSRGSRKIKE
mgnify:CR=1 FL=1